MGQQHSHTTYNNCTSESREKIYVAAVEALRKKDRQDETQFTAKIGGKTSLGKGQTG